MEPDSRQGDQRLFSQFVTSRNRLPLVDKFMLLILISLFRPKKFHDSLLNLGYGTQRFPYMGSLMPNSEKPLALKRQESHLPQGTHALLVPPTCGRGAGLSSIPFLEWMPPRRAPRLVAGLYPFPFGMGITNPRPPACGRGAG